MRRRSSFVLRLVVRGDRLTRQALGNRTGVGVRGEADGELAGQLEVAERRRERELLGEDRRAVRAPVQVPTDVVDIDPVDNCRSRQPGREVARQRTDLSWREREVEVDDRLGESGGTGAGDVGVLADELVFDLVGIDNVGCRPVRRIVGGEAGGLVFRIRLILLSGWQFRKRSFLYCLIRYRYLFRFYLSVTDRHC